MIEVTKNKKWTEGSYNTSFNERMKNGTEMGQYMEGADNDSLPTRCNCWEAIMLAAIDAGIYTKDDVKKLLTTVKKIARNQLIHYMQINPDKRVEYGSPDPTDLAPGLIVMFGKDGSHFALSVNGQMIVHLDRSEQGVASFSYLRQHGYKGQSFYPMFIKKPPIVPGDLVVL
jgi:hypothetical protein